MTVKSIIKVEVDDGAFKTFKALFDKYKEQAAEVPNAWAATNKEIGVASANFGDIVAAMMAQATLADALEKKQRAAANEAAKQGRFWRSLKTDTKEVAANIARATTSLLKWSGVVSAVGGLIGSGGLYGIDRLALDVGAGRRSSLGLGLGYGAQKAFETDFGRLVDPNSFLSGVTESLHDVRKRWMLSTAGADQGAIASGDAGAVGASLLENVKKLVDRTPANQLQQLSDARGLGQFFSLQDLVRLRATPASELADQERAFRSDSKSFGLSAATTRKWQDLGTQLTRAGNKIKTVFVDGLTPLTAPLSHLSDAVVKAIGTFLGVGNPERMKKISDALDRFANYIGGDEFQTDVKSFAADVGVLADAITGVLHTMGKQSFKDTLAGAGIGFVVGGPGGAVVMGGVGYGIGRATDGVPARPGQVIDKQGGYFPGGSAQRNFVSGTEKHYGLPAGVLTGIWGAESDFGRNKRAYTENAEHALGPFQFTPGTAKDYGLTDRTSLAGSADAAGRYMKTLISRYHGDVAKALAAYNWGPGNVDKDVARNGAGWQNHLPNETAKYVAKVLASAKKGASITINNNTGGSAVVAANQVR